MNKTIILKETNDYNYTLVPITKGECEEIQALMKLKITENEKYPFINDIEGCGHVSEVNDNILKNYVPVFNTYSVKKEYTPVINYVNEYKCFANPNRIVRFTSIYNILHEDRVSSFKCACSCINANYFYIIKETKNEFTDTNRNT